MSQPIGDERQHLLAQSLRRFAAVVLILAVLGGAAGASYAGSQVSTYSSSSRILLRPITGNPYSTETGPSSQQVTTAMTTEAALVSSEPVVQLVNEQVSPDLASGNIRAAVPPNTSTIVITVRASSPTRAQQGAQAVADGYLAYRQQVTSAAQEATLSQLGQQISGVKASLATASKNAAARGPDSQSARQAQALTEELISLQDLLNTARTTDTDPGTLVTPAAPGTRTGFGASLLIASGAAIGLMLGIAVALWLGLRDKRVHARVSPTVAGVPVLATLKGGRARDGGAADRQAYQRLRTTVLALAALPSAVAVSGVGIGETSAPIAWELGRSMTRAGYRVVLVMAGADEETLLTEDGAAPRGLADALRDGRSATGLLVERDGMALLAAGSGILEQQELLSGEKFAAIVDDLKSSFDYVLIVTGPAVLPAELATARRADILLLVGRDRTTSRVDVGDVSERARLVGVRMGGLVLRSHRWRPDASRRKRPSGPTPTSAPTVQETPTGTREQRRESHAAVEPR